MRLPSLLPLLVVAGPALASSVNSSASFDLKKHLGNLSPQFTPSFGLQGGLGVGMPDACSLEQIQLFHRHGSRFPFTFEFPDIANLSTKLNDPIISAKIDSLRLPKEWKFIQGENRWSTVLGVDLNNLTIPGRKECFDDGVKFRLAYPEMPFEHILAGESDRVIESAIWFRAGMFGQFEDEISSLSIIAEDNITISDITPQTTCPKWSLSTSADVVATWQAVYLPPIANRINKILKPAVQLTTVDVHGALYSCAYELAAFGNTTWCGVFEESEILEFEYELDLLMRSAFGYALPGDMGRVLGSLFVNNLVDRLTNAAANKTYIEFLHDTSLELALTGLGLAADKEYPATGPPNPNRSWRTSTQVPFAAHMVWEKWECSSSTQVRLLLNGAPFSLAPICKADKKTGACNLDDLVQGTSGIRSIKWGDATWNSTCGNPGF